MRLLMFCVPRGVLALTNLALLGACSGMEPTSDGDASVARDANGSGHKLIDAASWKLALATEDPFAGHRPGRVLCGEADWRIEPQGVEIDTRACNYATLVQPALARVARGERVQLFIWWQTLASKEASTAHVAIQAGATIIWQEAVAIPAPADVRNIDVPLLTDLEVGEPIFIHVRNHGYNNWSFGPITTAYPKKQR